MTFIELEYMVKVNMASDFTVLTDVIVESPELLIDKDSSSGVLRTGYFINQSHVNTYWNKFSINGTTKVLMLQHTQIQIL